MFSGVGAGQGRGAVSRSFSALGEQAAEGLSWSLWFLSSVYQEVQGPWSSSAMGAFSRLRDQRAGNSSDFRILHPSYILSGAASPSAHRYMLEWYVQSG